MTTRPLLFAAAAFAVNLVGAYLLDALGLVEGLLSPHGLTAVLLLPLAAAFYAARLLLFFVVPGLLFNALLLWAMNRAEARRRGGDPRAS